ncbi:LAFA_0D01706g1_1 [Lachancea sp. 'fantastica']|nr:LAFA_0D01706g1_1 [Lachancea sp. 'fantastica']
MVESKKHELKDANEKKRVKRRRNYDEHDKEVTAEDSKAKSSGKKDVKDTEDSSDESEDDEKLDLMLNKEDEDDDDLAEIDSTNIITGGRRTRGKVIDYKKTAEKLDKEAGKEALPEEDTEDGEIPAKTSPEGQNGNENGDEDEDEDEDDGDFKEPEK